MIVIPPNWPELLIGVFLFWLLVDQGSRIYLMYAPWEDYKDDQTESDVKRYKDEREEEAVKILRQYRIGRWLLKHRE